MNLQRILFPKVGVCTEQEMYFRISSKEEKAYYQPENERIEFSKRAEVYFDTYFNSFSIEKWRKYTKLNDVSLKLQLKGSFRITIATKEKIHEKVINKTIDQCNFKSEEKMEFNVNFNSYDEKGIYYFELEALEDNSYFYGGEYFTNIAEDKISEVNLGIVICTFKRESYMYRNMEIIKDNILENEKSPLSKHLHIYISDNGKSLDVSKIDHNNIHIKPNKNVGGAGGFTRGLMEILDSKKEYKITHALLMDDDIIIEPQALVKTYNFLKIVKDEYKEAFIGGAMLRIDEQSIQVESGGAWNAGTLNSLKQGLDLRQVDSILYNEIEEYSEFNAWWYCCFPIDVVTKENLPLPIFIRGDDVEYGLRNMKKLILLNGICVWHEPFENKYSSFLEYYIVRNLLIDNALHFVDYSKFQYLKFLFKRITRETLYYRYKNVDLIYRATKDFYRGIDWLKEQDGELLHKEIMDSGYKAQSVEELNIPFNYQVYDNSLNRYESKSKRLKRFLSLNGLLLKANRDNIVSMAQCTPANYYRAKRVLNYDVTTKKAFITEKSYKEIFRVYFKFIGIIFETLTKYDVTKKNYNTRIKEITNMDFWRKYLNLKN
jgi:GT2 family glycosyltransferase